MREPGRLRAWLCGIVRHLSANATRRERRRGGAPETLEAVVEPEAAGQDPARHAVTNEEAARLWRSLARLPENYREPMVLFYREQQSVADVAAGLDLSEDVVRQRLSRGRVMLREELTALVESTLVRTRPGPTFAASVLVALSLGSASTANAALAVGAMAQGGTGAVGKGLLAKLSLGMWIGPLIGLGGAYLGTRAAASRARSEAERACILRYAYGIIAFCVVMSLGLAAVLSQAGKLYTASAVGIVSGVSVWTALLVGGILLACQRLDRTVLRLRQETDTHDEVYAVALAAQGRSLRQQKYFASATRFLGLPLVALAWGGHDSDAARRQTVCGWVAVGDVAISPFLAFGGVAVAPIAVGGITVGVLSLSVFWGLAFGVLAVGSLAFGWWAVGCAAAGVKSAVGFAAVARDYAVGLVVSANEAGSAAAREWMMTQWFSDMAELFVHQAHWWVLGMLVAGLALGRWQHRQEHRRASRANR